MKRTRVALMTGMLVAGAAFTVPVAPAYAQEQTQARTQEPIYGYELMTEQERAEHRARMRSLTTEQEREQYRLEHHKKMQERAKERGVTLPEAPLPRGSGRGMGPGPGMGPGGQRP